MEGAMTVAELKQAALGWSQERADQLPDFAGACLGGYAALMEDADPFPHTSDIDLTIVLRGEGHDAMTEIEGEFRQQAILFRGVDLEPTYGALKDYENAENWLASHGAPAFTRPNVLLDPTGTLTRMQRAVAAGYRQERWVRKRCESARGMASWSLQVGACEVPR
jgi:hypothetical protein